MVQNVWIINLENSFQNKRQISLLYTSYNEEKWHKILRVYLDFRSNIYHILITAPVHFLGDQEDCQLLAELRGREVSLTGSGCIEASLHLALIIHKIQCCLRCLW